MEQGDDFVAGPYQRLIAYSPVAIAVHQNGRLVSVNSATVALIGASSPADLLGRSILDFVHPSFHEQVVERARTVEQTGESVEALTEQFVRLDGEVIDVEVVALPTLYRRRPAVQVVIRDVTAQRRAERALIREQEHLRLLVQASETLLGTLDSGVILGQILDLARRHVSADAYAVWRRSPPTGLWSSVASAGLSQEYTDAAIQAMNHSTEMPATPLVVRDLSAEPLLDRHRHLHAIQGTQALLVVPLRIHQAISGTLAFYFHRPHQFSDSEVHVALALANLAGAAITAAELYEEQTRLRAEAETAIRLRDQLLALVSHDVKNIVATIRGQAQLHLRALSRTPQPDVDRLRNGLTEIEGASQRMMNLLNDLLDVSFGRASQSLALQRQPTDLVALARQAVNSYEQTTERHRLRIETRLPELVGSWDATRLERVLGNLLSNAIKYSPDGGEIEVRVDEDVVSGERWAVLHVVDPGIGIPPQDLPHVFEPFRRGENASDYAEGAGLGLAGVRQIVTEHGGNVVVTSAEGRGSTFTLRLPIDCTR